MNERMKAYFKTHDYLRTSDASEIGCSRAVLSHLVSIGELQRVAQGVYALPQCLPDELAIIADRSANIVFSHETALVLHQLHNRFPERQSITLPQGCNVPRSIAHSVKVYHVKPACHDLGRSQATTFFGHVVPCYDRERTICDIVRSYSRVDIETYGNALRGYADRRDRNLSLLMEYARALGLEKKVRRTIEVLM